MNVDSNILRLSSSPLPRPPTILSILQEFAVCPVNKRLSELILLYESDQVVRLVHGDQVFMAVFAGVVLRKVVHFDQGPPELLHDRLGFVAQVEIRHCLQEAGQEADPFLPAEAHEKVSEDSCHREKLVFLVQGIINEIPDVVVYDQLLDLPVLSAEQVAQDAGTSLDARSRVLILEHVPLHDKPLLDRVKYVARLQHLVACGGTVVGYDHQQVQGCRVDGPAGVQKQLKYFGVVVFLDGVDEVGVLLEEQSQSPQGQLVGGFFFTFVKMIDAEQAEFGFQGVLGTNDRNSVDLIRAGLSVGLFKIKQVKYPKHTPDSDGPKIAGNVDDLDQLGRQPQLLQVIPDQLAHGSLHELAECIAQPIQYVDAFEVGGRGGGTGQVAARLDNIPQQFDGDDRRLQAELAVLQVLGYLDDFMDDGDFGLQVSLLFNNAGLFVMVSEFVDRLFGDVLLVGVNKLPHLVPQLLVQAHRHCLWVSLCFLLQGYDQAHQLLQVPIVVMKQ